jgi:hydrogenase expression/formation protein HypD
MRFVDEFRDAEKARALAAKIAALCEPGRQYKLMEVCGGHTHTIYKHGIEDYLPESITLVHGPGRPRSSPPRWPAGPNGVPGGRCRAASPADRARPGRRSAG